MKEKTKTDEILEKLDQGLTELFNSENYQKYLDTMSKFHNYSFNNTLLIALQKPDASLVAGYTDWQRKFHRQVQKGEKGINILAPAPYKKEVQKEVTNPITGLREIEKVEVILPAYKAVAVFDISQTEGEDIPRIGVDELVGDVENYDMMKNSLADLAPVPIHYEKIQGDSKGYYSIIDKKIVINEGMEKMQEIKTLIHEIAHSLLHDVDNIHISKTDKVALELLNSNIETNMGQMSVIDYLDYQSRTAGYGDYCEMINNGITVTGYEDITSRIIELDKQIKNVNNNQETKEVQSESIAYAVCQHFGIDTSDYSFGYIAGWSSGKEKKELKESMETIRKTVNHMVTGIEKKLMQKEEIAKQPEPAISKKKATKKKMKVS